MNGIFEGQLKNTYESMTCQETYQLHSQIARGKGPISPLRRLNSTVYDTIIADPYFGTKPKVDKIFGLKYSPVSMLVAFVR